MPLKILGLNHTTAPVEIREQVIYTDATIPGALAEIRTLPGIGEAVLLSTCNRTEIYVDTSLDNEDSLLEWLMADQNLTDEARQALFVLTDDAAVRHLFRVACGLDSMVLGEPQILGQLKEAFRQADGAGSVGTSLGRLFQHTFSVA